MHKLKGTHQRLRGDLILHYHVKSSSTAIISSKMDERNKFVFIIFNIAVSQNEIQDLWRTLSIPNHTLLRNLLNYLLPINGPLK